MAANTKPVAVSQALEVLLVMCEVQACRSRIRAKNISRLSILGIVAFSDLASRLRQASAPASLR